MANCKPGDRIRLIEMPNDPSPIEPGSEGTVLEINNEGREIEQIDVKWDSGRTLMLTRIDRYEVI